MEKFVGVWKLEEPIYCKKEVSGKSFESIIGGMKVCFCFPSCPEEMSEIGNTLDKGDLIAPLKFMQEEINWGTIHAWPEGLFSVNALLCIGKGDESIIEKIYEDFPRWKEKFEKLVLIDSGNFIRPEQKPLSLLQYGNGIYDGLEIFMVKDSKKIERKINNRHLDPIELSLVSREQCYSTEKISMLLKNAGDSKDIIFPYELLIVAYRAVIRHDFRSAIIIAGTAVEKAILARIQKFYDDNQQMTFEADRKKHKMLGKEFAWLSELGLAIPVQDYQTQILDIRNPTAHEGKSQNYSTTIKYLENCKTIIQTYSSNILETINEKI